MKNLALFRSSLDRSARSLGTAAAALAVVAVALIASPEAAGQAAFTDIGASLESLVVQIGAALAVVVIAAVSVWSGFHLTMMAVRVVQNFMRKAASN